MNDVYSAQELKERIENNDNRATAKPYLLLLQRASQRVCHDEFDHGYDRVVYVEQYSGDYGQYDTLEELRKSFREYYDDEDKLLEEKHWREFKIEETYITENVFLTDKGYEEHKEVNGHNLSKHRTYGIHAFRNKEIRSLFALIDSNIEKDLEIAELKKQLDICADDFARMNMDTSLKRVTRFLE